MCIFVFMRKRKYTKEFLEPIVEKCYTVSAVMRILGVRLSGGTHSLISKRIKEYEIDTSHFLGQRHNTGKPSMYKHTKESFTKEVLCVDGKRWNSHAIKLRLFEYEMKENICEGCKQCPTWNGAELKMQLEHINGNHEDNRIENLKILCPNCHSQTSTFCRK